MTQNSKSKKARVAKMRTEVSNFGYVGVKETSRESSKVYGASLHCRLVDDSGLQLVREALQLNENVVSGSIQTRGHHSSVMIEFKIDVCGIHNPEAHSRRVVCDIIAAIENRAQRMVETAPAQEHTPERPTRGRRHSRH